MPDVPSSATPAPIPDLVQRYLNGESIQTLAREHAVHRQTIYHWLLAECGPAYDQVITHALVNRIAEADRLLEESTSMFDIARAREAMRFTRMDFERRRPKLYGPKQEVAVDTSLTIIVQRQGKTPRDITVSPGQISDEHKDINTL